MIRKSKHKCLLFIDAFVNVILGILLIMFPVGIVDALGLPASNTNFYPGILGAVLFGIGCALCLELFGFEKNIRGLGLGGAVVINFVGAFALIGWLISGNLTLPVRGWILLWAVAAIVLLIGIAEVFAKFWRYEK